MKGNKINFIGKQCDHIKRDKVVIFCVYAIELNSVEIYFINTIYMKLFLLKVCTFACQEVCICHLPVQKIVLKGH